MKEGITTDHLRLSMNAANYFDWWHYSGTGLGTVYPGEKFKQLHQELSPAGANIIIVGEFLEQNPGTLDIERWRRTHVYGLVGCAGPTFVPGPGSSRCQA